MRICLLDEVVVYMARQAEYRVYYFESGSLLYPRYWLLVERSEQDGLEPALRVECRPIGYSRASLLAVPASDAVAPHLPRGPLPPPVARRLHQEFEPLRDPSSLGEILLAWPGTPLASNAQLDEARSMLHAAGRITLSPERYPTPAVLSPLVTGDEAWQTHFRFGRCILAGIVGALDDGMTEFEANYDWNLNPDDRARVLRADQFLRQKYTLAMAEWGVSRAADFSVARSAVDLMLSFPDSGGIRRLQDHPVMHRK